MSRRLLPEETPGSLPQIKLLQPRGSTLSLFNATRGNAQYLAKMDYEDLAYQRDLSFGFLELLMNYRDWTVECERASG